MPMNLNTCVTDEEIEHDSAGLQTLRTPCSVQEHSLATGLLGHMVFPNAYIDLSLNLLGTMFEPMRQ